MGSCHGTAVRARILVLVCGLSACQGPDLELPNPPPGVQAMAVLGLTDGHLIEASAILPVTLGLAPLGLKPPKGETVAVLGWRSADGLSPDLIGAGPLVLASPEGGVPTPSYAVQAAAGAPVEAFMDWSQAPLVDVAGRVECDRVVPQDAALSLTCDLEACAGTVRQMGCNIEINATGCGLSQVQASVDAQGAWAFATDQEPDCSSGSEAVPGATSSFDCLVDGVNCHGRVMAPTQAPRFVVQSRRLFAPGTQDWLRDGDDLGWLAEPVVGRSGVLVLQRAAPARGDCSRWPQAMLHLISSQTLETVATATVSGCTWAVAALASGDFLALEGGPAPAVQRLGLGLTPRLRVSVPPVQGGLYYPSAVDVDADRVMVIWDEEAPEERLAYASRVAPDFTVLTVQLDTPRVSGVAFRPDDRFVVLDQSDKRVSQHVMVAGGREDSFRVGIISRPLRHLAHDPTRYDSWVAVGGAVSPQVFVTGPDSFRAEGRVAPVYEVDGEPWTIARWPPVPHLAVVGVGTRSGAGPAYVGLLDPSVEQPYFYPGLQEVGQGPIVGGAADPSGRVWMALPAEGTVLRIEPW